jgi:CelD/BcsL family acetyltransferase involved in cellulose biosynthesis
VPPGDWENLAERSGNVFATPEWTKLWWAHFSGGDPLVAMCRDETGAPVAIVSLELRLRSPLRVARFAGHGAADQLGPVAAAGDGRGGEALAMLRDRFDLLLAERLPGTGWEERLSGRSLLREASPVVAVPDGGWDEYLAGRSSNLRSQVRRKERKLLRDHGLDYRLCDDPARLDADMGTLVDLHAARWGRGATQALRPERAAFHLEFARVALERGWLRLWMAEVGGRAVAAWYGFRYGDAEWYYQSGRDPAWERASVGLVLLAHTIREAMNDGVREYKLLRGGEAYKDRFATSDPGLETVSVGRGAVGAAVARAAPAAVALRRAFRRR